MTTETPPPSTGSHLAQASAPPSWRSVALTVIAPLVIAALGAAVTWGVLKTRIDVIEADIHRLREQAATARAQTRADVAQLQVAQAVASRDDAAMKDLWAEIVRRLGRIEDRLDQRRDP